MELAGNARTRAGSLLRLHSNLTRWRWYTNVAPGLLADPA